MDAFLQHIKEQANPVISRQINCVLQLWQQLDSSPDKDEAEEAGADDAEVDDDPQDHHSHVGFGLDEAETIHSWGE